MSALARKNGPLLAIAIFFAMAACAPKRELPRIETKLPPIILQEKLPELTEAQIIDSAVLIEKADALKNEGNFEQAEAIYRQVCQFVGTEPICLEAELKRADCLVKLQRVDEAKKILNELTAQIQDVSMRLEVLEQLASLEEALGNFSRAVELRAEASDLSKSNPILNFHHRVRLALNLVQLKKPQAESLLDSLIKEAEYMQWHRLPIEREDEAALYFHRAEFIKTKHDSIKFRGTDKEMEEQVTRKAELLYDAKKMYIRAIKTHHPLWMSAALYRIGEMYEEFYYAVMEAPVPPMKLDEKKEYVQMLEEKVSLVKEKAVWLYRKNLRLAEQLGIENEWIDKSKEALKRLTKANL